MAKYISLIKRIAVVAIMMFLYAGNSAVYAEIPGDDTLKNASNTGNEAGEAGFKKFMKGIKEKTDKLAKDMGYGENGGMDLFFDAVDMGKSIASGENPMDLLNKLNAKYGSLVKSAVSNKFKKEKEKREREKQAQQQLEEEKAKKEGAEKQVDEEKKQAKKKKKNWLKNSYNWLTHNPSAMSGLTGAANALRSGDTDGALDSAFSGANGAAMNAYEERQSKKANEGNQQGEAQQ